MLSTILLSSLGINYLLDLNRNKKNDMFYKEVEKKLNEELTKNIRFDMAFELVKANRSNKPGE
jgi:hypothetical protein